MQEKDLAKARTICMELGEKFQIEVFDGVWLFRGLCIL